MLSRQGQQHQLNWGQAFHDGLRRHGVGVRIVGEYAPADLVIMWGTRRTDLIARAKADGCRVCILERGYLGDRMRWTSVSFGGGLNGRAEFRGPFNDARRFETHFADLMKPWRRQDGYALILGQVPGDMSVRDANIGARYVDWADTLLRRGIAVKFRPHPKADRRRFINLEPMAANVSLAEALAGASWALTWNSNGGVDAVMAGVPTVTMDEGAMAWPVTGHSIDEEPPMPDRSAWAARLAWCQFTKEEMSSGFCWEAISQ